MAGMINIKGYVVTDAPGLKAHGLFVQNGYSLSQQKARCGHACHLGWTTALPLLDNYDAITCGNCRRILHLPAIVQPRPAIPLLEQQSNPVKEETDEHPRSISNVAAGHEPPKPQHQASLPDCAAPSA